MDKYFTASLSGKTEDDKPFSCQITLTPMSGELPDEFWTALLNTLVDIRIMNEEEMETENGKA